MKKKFVQLYFVVWKIAPKYQFLKDEKYTESHSIPVYPENLVAAR